MVARLHHHRAGSTSALCTHDLSTRESFAANEVIEGHRGVRVINCHLKTVLTSLYSYPLPSLPLSPKQTCEPFRVNDMLVDNNGRGGGATGT